MKFGVVVFPGSNCDDDMIHVLDTVMDQNVVKIWHKNSHLPSFTSEDCIILPGGFSYGDYLRAGAIARFSPVMKAVISFAKSGGMVWGICNGFQILCEAGLLPGALLRNANEKFICKNVFLKIESTKSPVTNGLNENSVLKIPVAHADGRYYVDSDTLKNMIENEQVLFRYCDENGEPTSAANVNGSLYNIAGICDRKKRIIGMMPHPERASEDVLGNVNGKIIIQNLITFARSSVSV